MMSSARFKLASQNQVSLSRLTIMILPKIPRARCSNPAHLAIDLTQPTTDGAHRKATRRWHSNNFSF